MSRFSKVEAGSADNRWLMGFCLLAAAGISGLLPAGKPKVSTRMASERRGPAATLSPSSLKPVSANLPGQNLRPQIITYVSEASQVAAREAAQIAARAVYGELLASRNWNEAATASGRLAKIGKAAVPFLLEAAENGDRDISFFSRQQLRSHFPEEPEFIDLLIRTLENKDADSGFRYESAFHLGHCKIERAADALRRAYKEDEKLRLTAAKSLAELGEKDVARTLYGAMSSDHYMERYQANLGFKALAGRDLADTGYNWREGAFVSGGGEHRLVLNPIDDNEKRARRYQAVADYFKWLKAERPDIYAEIDPLTRKRQAGPTNGPARGG